MDEKRRLARKRLSADFADQVAFVTAELRSGFPLERVEAAQRLKHPVAENVLGKAMYVSDWNHFGDRYSCFKLLEIEELVMLVYEIVSHAFPDLIKHKAEYRLLQPTLEDFQEVLELIKNYIEDPTKERANIVGTAAADAYSEIRRLGVYYPSIGNQLEGICQLGWSLVSVGKKETFNLLQEAVANTGRFGYAWQNSPGADKEEIQYQRLRCGDFLLGLA